MPGYYLEKRIPSILIALPCPLSPAKLNKSPSNQQQPKFPEAKPCYPQPFKSKLHRSTVATVHLLLQSTHPFLWNHWSHRNTAFRNAHTSFWMPAALLSRGPTTFRTKGTGCSIAKNCASHLCTLPTASSSSNDTTKCERKASSVKCRVFSVPPLNG